MAEGHQGLWPGLARGVEAWRERGDAGPLLRWLDRELDADGVPKRWPTTEWGACLAVLAEAMASRPRGGPTALRTRIEGLARAAWTFSRPDGSPVFGPEPAQSRTRPVRRKARPGGAEDDLRSVAADPPRPLAMLRDDQAARGDFLAMDRRDRLGPCRFELFGMGRTWLGPIWPSEATGPARVIRRLDDEDVAYAEWSFRTPAARVTRTALLLKGRQFALLADQVEGMAPAAELRFPLAGGVEPVASAEARSLILADGPARSIRLVPLGLPCRAYPTERGSFSVEGGEVVLRQPNPDRRTWLPMLASWRPGRDRRATFWRTLTVSEKSRACAPGVAFAARVAWGSSESLVVYRSLARPAPRAFLGHQTTARFLVGVFTRTGEVEPILSIED